VRFVESNLTGHGALALFPQPAIAIKTELPVHRHVGEQETLAELAANREVISFVTAHGLRGKSVGWT